MNPIILPVAELKPVLIGLGKIISKRTTLPVLGCVHIERTKSGAIELTATDLDVLAIATLPTVTQGEPTSLLVPLEDLQNLTKSCGRGDALIIGSVDHGRVAIKFLVGSQMLEHRCESLPVEEFPANAIISGPGVLFDESLRQAIDEALQCASTDATRLILNGAYLDVSNPKTHYVVGTDGRHLFSSNSFNLDLKESLIIPSHRFLQWKEFRGDGDWTLRVAKPEKDGLAHFELSSPHWRFIARALDGNYPNWRAVLPATGSAQTTVEFDPEGVEAVIQTIARLPNYDAVNYTIRLESKDRRLNLLSKSASDDEWNRVVLDGVKPLGRDVTVHLNRHLVTKALRFGLTRLEIIDAMAPVRFSNGGRQMIVMPTRPDPVRQATSAASPIQPTPAAQPQSTAPNPPPQTEQLKEEPMPETNGTTGSAKRPATNASETTDKPALEIALAQIEVVRGEFRNAIAGLNKLADALKQVQREQKAGDKEIQSVRQTLRSLQTVRI